MMNVGTRNNMFSVMAHTGFSGIKYTASNHVVYELPAKAIRNDGVIKKAWMKRLKNTTVEAANWMMARSAVVFIS